MSTTTVKPISVKFDGDLQTRIKLLAIAHDRSVRWLMLRAIEQYLEREEQQEAKRQIFRKAWEEYEASGFLHITAEEAKEWISSPHISQI